MAKIWHQVGSDQANRHKQLPILPQGCHGYCSGIINSCGIASVCSKGVQNPSVASPRGNARGKWPWERLGFPWIIPLVVSFSLFPIFYPWYLSALFPFEGSSFSPSTSLGITLEELDLGIVQPGVKKAPERPSCDFHQSW